MNWNFKHLAKSDISKLLTGSIVPRPIALVTTCNPDGTVNAAPFSFFNLLSTDPAVLTLGIDGHADAADGMKDTARNILRDRQFVVNMVDEALLPAMNICAVEFPPNVDETIQSGLDTAPSIQVSPPRLHASPIQFECRLMNQVPLKPGKSILIGEVLHMHARDELVDTHYHIDSSRLNLVGRMAGGGWYVRTSDRFHISRLTYEEWLASSEPRDKQCSGDSI